MTDTVELVEVSKHYGPLIAVDRLSFAVSPGETIALLGPSGCGKTTTLRLIAGFETPDTGTLRLAGEDVARKRPYRAVHRIAVPALRAVPAHERRG